MRYDNTVLLYKYFHCVSSQYVMSLSSLQVDLPEGVTARYAHSITIAWAGNNEVMVVVHGGRRSGETIADTTIIHLGKLAQSVISCLCNVSGIIFISC